MATALCSVESVGCKPEEGISDLPRTCGPCPHHTCSHTHTNTQTAHCLGSFNIPKGEEKIKPTEKSPMQKPQLCGREGGSL